MPKINAVLMVVLSVAVIGVLGWRALGQGDDGAAERARAAKILRKLADPDPDLRREAAGELKAMGARGKELLRETAKGADTRLAERAAAVLKELEPLPDAPAPDAGPESLLAGLDGFRVEFRNPGPAPLLIALEKKGEEPRFGFFELLDAEGRAFPVRAESYAPPVVEGDAHVVVIPPGAKQVLYKGGEALAAALRAAPDRKVRFVYDASEGSPYRLAAPVSTRGVPLRPSRHAIDLEFR